MSIDNAVIKNNENIVWHEHAVDKKQRSEQKKQRPCVLWFTGLSGSGKSTVAGAVEQALFELGAHTYLLDGDNVRMGLCKGLTFSDADRKENIRRIGEVAKLMADAGLIVLTAFISPHRIDRDQVRELLPQAEFIEVFVDTPLAICEQRDPKGLYKKARAGEIKNFTGIDSVYEAPESAEIRVENGDQPLSEAVNIIINYLRENGYV
ncbi:adenylyl-sulfate kinase [Psychromonas ossibalaenae]|uniref:adenylyl-sulfate kinase n=1 Tax=Psychromonas ossibalaenae TaxID=444922 RepID=UPI00036776EC|nr:adenylyl-sulfate kinase [Psychromonas ossibalaenae]